MELPQDITKETLLKLIENPQEELLIAFFLFCRQHRWHDKNLKHAWGMFNIGHPFLSASAKGAKFSRDHWESVEVAVLKWQTFCLASTEHTVADLMAFYSEYIVATNREQLIETMRNHGAKGNWSPGISIEELNDQGKIKLPQSMLLVLYRNNVKNISQLIHFLNSHNWKLTNAREIGKVKANSIMQWFAQFDFADLIEQIENKEE